MSKELSTRGKNDKDSDKALPGPLEDRYDDQCDACGRGVDLESSCYSVDGPGGTVLRIYCSARCLGTVMDPDLVKILAQEVTEELKK